MHIDLLQHGRDHSFLRGFVHALMTSGVPVGSTKMKGKVDLLAIEPYVCSI